MALSETDLEALKRDANVCSTCSGNAPLPVLICFKCSEGTHEVGLPVVTKYCSATCLRADEAEHEPRCHEKNDCKRLHRAGELLQRVFYCWRQLLFDMKIKSVSPHEGVVEFFEDKYNGDEGPLFEFPVDMFTSYQDAKAVVTYCACNDALSYMFELTKKALEDITTSCEEAYVKVEPYWYKAIRHFQTGQMDIPMYRHVILIVTSNNGEQYSLDLAGAQLGQYDPIHPLEDSLETYEGEITKRHEHGYQNELRLKKLRGEMDQFLLPTTDFRIEHVQGEALKHLNRAIEDFEKRRGQSIKNLLCLSEKHYKKGVNMLLDTVADCLRTFVRDYSTGKIHIVPRARQRAYGDVDFKDEEYQRQVKEMKDSMDEESDEVERRFRSMGFEGTFFSV